MRNEVYEYLMALAECGVVLTDEDIREILKEGE